MQLKVGKEGFVCTAELPSSANIRNPTLNLWQSQPTLKEEVKEIPSPDPAFPVIVRVYIGALTVLGLYFIYRCTKR